MKICTGCGLEKAIAEFTKGYARCHVCKARDKRERKALAKRGQKVCYSCKRTLPLAEFTQKEPPVKGRHRKCSSCLDPNGSKLCIRCGEVKPKVDFRYHKTHKRWESYCRSCQDDYDSDYQRMRWYRLSPPEYKALLEEQDGCCAICGKWVEVLHVDHDHACCSNNRSTCGKCRRGLLCDFCNRGLGMFLDDTKSLQNAITYLESFRDANRRASAGNDRT